MKIYTIQELRNAPIQIKVYSQEQAIKLAYAVGQKTDWKPFEANYPIYCYLNECNFPSWNSSENERKSDKPTTIEFNQIEDFMEDKKIIGYKLIKPEYIKAIILITETSYSHKGLENLTSEFAIEKLTKAEVLDIWFEPIYEEEYKVGDWVITKGYHKNYDGIALKITLINSKKYCYFEHNDIGTPNFNIRSIERKATPEEIQQAQKTIVKMYSSNKGEFKIEVIDGKAYYSPENKHLPKEWIRDIINSYGNILIQKNVINPYNVEISSINVGCYHNCKKENWEKVYKLLK